MSFTHAVSTNKFGAAKIIVSTAASDGTHTTLATAMAAASAGDTILMRNSVTENVTITPGVDIVAWPSSPSDPTISITGKLTMTGAGSSTISGIDLITNSDFFLAVTGSANSIVYLKDCYLNCLNNTGISYTSSGASSNIYILNCRGNIGTTGISLFAGSGAGGMDFQYCRFQNSGSSTTASTMSSTGQYFMKFCQFENVFSNSGTGAGLQIFHCFFNTGALNTTVLSIASTAGGGASIDGSTIDGGTASAITIGVGATVVSRNNTIKSSNTNCITETGASTYQYGETLYSGTSSKINVTTQTLLLASSFQKIVVQTFTGNGTYTPTSGMKWCTIEAIGSGGGGAGAPTTGASTVACGGGGSGGSYARITVSAATIGTSQAVTVPSGGTGGVGNAAGNPGSASSVGTICVGNGGNGGSNQAAGAIVIANGASGGSGGTGDFTVTGGGGGQGIGYFVATPGALITGGFGGSSHFAGTRESVGNGNNNGNTGNNYGGGGGGATNTNSAGATKTGGNGGPGIVIITEYI